MVKQSVLGDYSVRARGASLSSRSREAKSKIYWFVIKGANRNYRVRALNEGCMPSGVVKELDMEEFMTHFDPEPVHYVEETVPAIRRHLEDAKGLEEKRAVAAKLGLEVEGGEAEIDRFMKDLFNEARLVRFRQSREINEYAILLRKRNRLDEAVRFSRQALDLSPRDEHLLFNAARVHYEKKEYAKASELIDQALELRPDMEQAVKFKRHLVRKIRSNTISLNLD